MASIVVKGVPDRLRARLKKEAQRNRRSVNQQILHMLDRSMDAGKTPGPPPPVRLKSKLTQARLSRAIARGLSPRSFGVAH
jgi:hypothetical protein